jgi:Icc protein
MKQIAFITDIHLNEQFILDNNINATKNFETVLADIERRKINELVFGGDIGESTSHKYFFEKLRGLSINLILGNHDKFDKVKEYFSRDEYKDELYYKVDDEKYQYIFLDTSSNELSKKQLEWITTQLYDKKKLILFSHHPILKIDTPVDIAYPLTNREELKNVLLNFKNSVALFCGHYHLNDEQELENIKQYVTQAISYQIVKNATEIKIDNLNFGYRIIKISEDSIETEIVNFKQ